MLDVFRGVQSEDFIFEVFVKCCSRTQKNVLVVYVYVFITENIFNGILIRYKRTTNFANAFFELRRQEYILFSKEIYI